MKPILRSSVKRDESGSAKEVKCFSCRQKNMSLFYKSSIQSVLLSWYENINIKDKNEMKDIVKVDDKVIAQATSVLDRINEHPAQ